RETRKAAALKVVMFRHQQDLKKPLRRSVRLLADTRTNRHAPLNIGIVDGKRQSAPLNGEPTYMDWNLLLSFATTSLCVGMPTELPA
nr:hypothetical protein [Endozoicomonas sp.]